MRRSVRTPHLALLLGLVAAAGAAVGPAPVGAQTLADYDYVHLRFRGIGLGGGYLWSDRIEDVQRYTLRLDLGYLGPGVRIAPSITYWSSELAGPELETLADRLTAQTGSPVTGDDLGPVEWADLSVTVDGHFVWSTPMGFFLYLGTGLGLHALNGGGPAVDGTFVEDLLDNVTAGVDGVAGLELEVGDRLRLFTEGRYTAMIGLRYASLGGGLQLMLSQGGVDVGALPAPGAPAAAPDTVVATRSNGAAPGRASPGWTGAPAQGVRP
ncbi:MAG: hypothetical protein ACOCUW_00970 [Gemmatimonadota bacterium]